MHNQTSPERISGAEALLRSLQYQGTETVFGYPGGQAIPIFDALYDFKDIRYILTRHEQGATHAAQGYARVSGKAGVCIVTSGPGATNTITGIGDAMLDSTPMVVIMGQVGVSMLGTDAFQEIDVVGITQPITKWSYQIRSANEISWAVARAFYIAQSGRPGPVVLDFTKNAQTEQVYYRPEKCRFIRSYLPKREIDETRVQAAAQLINSAQKPLALIGQGVILGQAEKEVIAFLEKADIPAAYTLLGESAMPSDFRLNQGMVGMHGNIAPNMKTNECDVLIAIGMRFDDRVTGNLNTYAKQARIIHFDIDPAEIDKNVKTDVAIVGDVKQSLPMLTALIHENRHTEWIDSFAEHHKREQETVIARELHPTSATLSMGEVVDRISAAVGHDAVVVTDVGQNQMIAARYSRFRRSRCFVTSGGLGTMGFGIPAAIGAKIAAPREQVILYTGDGGFQMTMQELGTIMQENTGVKMVILNNDYLGMVRQWQELFYGCRYSATPLVNPDFGKIAQAYGIATTTVTRRDQLDEAIADMLRDDRPYLLVVHVEPQGIVYPMTPAGETVTHILTE